MAILAVLDIHGLPDEHLVTPQSLAAESGNVQHVPPIRMLRYS